MTRLWKIMVLAAVVLYIVSPVDAAPGPSDDFLFMLMGLMLQNHVPAILPGKNA